MLMQLLAAKKESKKSKHLHKVGCVIAKGNRILSKGYNQVRHASTGKRYTNYPESLHAERDACRKVPKKLLKGATAYIYRESNVGNPMLARSCSYCERLLISVGISKIVYTINSPPYYAEYKL